MKFFTQVDLTPLKVGISLADRILILGSCFADGVGARMKAAGFDVCVNPFGTLYNPASVLSALERLDSGEPFKDYDCVEMGAGAGLVCSFSHHTSFARADEDAFLENANRALSEASSFWKSCTRLIVTFGTAMVWKHDGRVVSNCLKRPAVEFTHEMLSLEETTDLTRRIMAFGKPVIFTVSPIRHLSHGAHVNTLSKSTLHLALDRAGACCFDAYEIFMDELRDYRFCTEDLCHPNPQAVQFIWERFVAAAVPPSEHNALRENEKAARQAAHRPISVSNL